MYMQVTTAGGFMLGRDGFRHGCGSLRVFLGIIMFLREDVATA